MAHHKAKAHKHGSLDEALGCMECQDAVKQQRQLEAVIVTEEERARRQRNQIHFCSNYHCAGDCGEEQPERGPMSLSDGAAWEKDFGWNDKPEQLEAVIVLPISTERGSGSPESAICDEDGWNEFDASYWARRHPDRVTIREKGTK